MKRTTIYISTALIAAMMFGGQLRSSSTGTPQQASGGPKESGNTCAQGGCHSGSATAVDNIITTTIPTEGYTPGTTYTITVSTTGTGSDGAKGFMVSAQNASGTLMGTMTAGSGSKKVFTNYITHSSAQFSSTPTWSFQWTAPVVGSGTVTFYGAFAVDGRNATVTDQLTVQEKMGATALLEVSAGQTLAISPNPIADETLLSYRLAEQGPVSIRLVSIDGKISETLYSGNQSAGEQSQQLNLGKFPSGIYFMQVETTSGTAYQKVLVNR
jgi:hypothetical protein